MGKSESSKSILWALSQSRYRIVETLEIVSRKCTRIVVEFYVMRLEVWRRALNNIGIQLYVLLSLSLWESRTYGNQHSGYFVLNPNASIYLLRNLRFSVCKLCETQLIYSWGSLAQFIIGLALNVFMVSGTRKSMMERCELKLWIMCCFLFDCNASW